jgi:hypothetical protein
VQSRKREFFHGRKRKTPIRFQTPPLHTVGDEQFYLSFWGFSVNV